MNKKRIQVRPEGYHRWQKIRKRYGLTREDYDRILDEQGGGCAICGRTGQEDPTNPKKMVVDHDHTRNEVHFRGIICNSCNIALGCIMDDPAIARRMVAYLNERKT